MLATTTTIHVIDLIEPYVEQVVFDVQQTAEPLIALNDIATVTN